MTDPPENVKLELKRVAELANLICATADACSEPSFRIFLNETKFVTLVKNGTTYTIPEVNISHVGNYTCVSVNGNVSSDPEYLSLSVGKSCW